MWRWTCRLPRSPVSSPSGSSVSKPVSLPLWGSGSQGFLLGASSFLSLLLCFFLSLLLCFFAAFSLSLILFHPSPFLPLFSFFFFFRLYPFFSFSLCFAFLFLGLSFGSLVPFGNRLPFPKQLNRQQTQHPCILWFPFVLPLSLSVFFLFGPRADRFIFLGSRFCFCVGHRAGRFLLFGVFPLIASLSLFLESHAAARALFFFPVFFFCQRAPIGPRLFGGLVVFFFFPAGRRPTRARGGRRAAARCGAWGWGC